MLIISKRSFSKSFTLVLWFFSDVFSSECHIFVSKNRKLQLSQYEYKEEPNSLNPQQEFNSSKSSEFFSTHYHPTTTCYTKLLKMIYSKDLKFACDVCVNGHRARDCLHFNRIPEGNVYVIQDRGRPSKERAGSATIERVRLKKALLDPEQNIRCPRTGRYVFQCTPRCCSNCKKAGVYLREEGLDLVKVVNGVEVNNEGIHSALPKSSRSRNFTRGTKTLRGLSDTYNITKQESNHGFNGHGVQSSPIKTFHKSFGQTTVIDLFPLKYNHNQDEIDEFSKELEEVPMTTSFLPNESLNLSSAFSSKISQPQQSDSFLYKDNSVFTQSKEVTPVESNNTTSDSDSPSKDFEQQLATSSNYVNVNGEYGDIFKDIYGSDSNLGLPELSTDFSAWNDQYFGHILENSFQSF